MKDLVRTSDGATLGLSGFRADGQPEGGPAFLLIHGFAQSAAAFEEGGWPSGLARRGARVFVGELRGRTGLAVDDASPRVRARPWSLAQHLRLDLPALIEAVKARTGANKIHIVGHSMGGLLGYGLLDSAADSLASLTTLGAPVILGRHRPLVRLAALAAEVGLPANTPALPTDLMLRWVRGFAARPVRPGIARGRFRELVRLSNPEITERARAKRVLEAAEAESTRVLLDLARLARMERPHIDGIDLIDAVARSTIPIAAVVGGRDVFCGPQCVAPLRAGAGPRRIIVLPEYGHVDLTLGNSVASLLDELYPFLLA